MRYFSTLLKCVTTLCHEKCMLSGQEKKKRIIIKFNCCHHDLFTQEQNTTNDDELAFRQKTEAQR